MFKKNAGEYAAVRRTQWRLLNCNYWALSVSESSWKRVLMLSRMVQLATFNQLKSTCKDSNNGFLVQRAPWWKDPVSESAFSHWRWHRSVLFFFLSCLLLLKEKKKVPPLVFLGGSFCSSHLKVIFSLSLCWRYQHTHKEPCPGNSPKVSRALFFLLPPLCIQPSLGDRDPHRPSTQDTQGRPSLLSPSSFLSFQGSPFLSGKKNLCSFVLN